MNPNGPINWISVGANTVFANPWTAAAIASATTVDKDGNTSISSFQSWFASTLFNGAIGSFAGKVLGNGDKYVPRKFITNSENGARTVAGMIIGSWGNNLSTTGVNLVLPSADDQTTSSDNTNNTNNEQ